MSTWDKVVDKIIDVMMLILGGVLVLMGVGFVVGMTGLLVGWW